MNQHVDLLGFLVGVALTAAAWVVVNRHRRKQGKPPWWLRLRGWGLWVNVIAISLVVLGVIVGPMSVEYGGSVSKSLIAGFRWGMLLGVGLTAIGWAATALVVANRHRREQGKPPLRLRRLWLWANVVLIGLMILGRILLWEGYDLFNEEGTPPQQLGVLLLFMGGLFLFFFNVIAVSIATGIAIARARRRAPGSDVTR